MTFSKARFGVIFLLALWCAGTRPERASGQLRWPETRKEELKLRLVALAWNHPRSSFATNEEVFVAEMQLTKDESRLVKLVYMFLPYQPRLSAEGLDYDTVHELRAARDPECDERLAQIVAGRSGDWRQEESQLKYSIDAPELNVARHNRPLPCYVTAADDYGRPVRDE